MAVTCDFRFEVRPEDEVVVLEVDHRTARVCMECLALLTVHRRMHHMKVERVIVEMVSVDPCWLKLEAVQFTALVKLRRLGGRLGHNSQRGSPRTGPKTRSTGKHRGAEG